MLNATLILYNTTSIANLEQAAAHTRALIREESQMSVGAVGRPIQKIKYQATQITSLLGGCSHTAAKFLAQQAGVVFIDSFTWCFCRFGQFHGEFSEASLHSLWIQNFIVHRKARTECDALRQGLSNFRNTQCCAGMQHSSKCISKGAARNVKFVEQIHSKAS